MLARAAATAGLDDDGLRAALQALRAPLAGGRFRPEPVEAGLALLSEVSRRLTGLQPHAVQLMGALALVDGCFAEMQTGEGKTLVAALVAALAGLSGVPVHVVTVNDYLAQRDADLARPMLQFAGLTVAAVLHEHDVAERRVGYRCDVTFVANKEVAFDYLRDRVALRSRGPGTARAVPAPVVPILRGLHLAIIDEADSILIDEARTPLILSEPAAAPADDGGTRLAMAAAGQLVEHDHYTLEPHRRQVSLTEAGRRCLDRILVATGIDQGMAGPWRARQAREEMVRTALAARHLYWRDRDYVVVEGRVRIVDEHTGRIAEGRSWQNGLQQMIEAIEGVPPSPDVVTRTSITYQSFFNRYRRLAGLSGTLREVAVEARIVYGHVTARIPTHKPSRRRELGLRLLPSDELKRHAVVAAASAMVEIGRPVLIGTRSVAASERLSCCLAVAGLAHVVLNALHDADEAAIVAKAGQGGCITVATSMAGRGTDIRLDASARRLGGLHVILTELHESSRVDRQLIGRGGRQGDPGTFETILSLEDELLQDHAGLWVAGMQMLSGVWGRLPRRAARWLIWRAQLAASRRHRRERVQLARAHERQEQMLSFAGDG